ncbi:MAG: hypothetical protein IJR89_07460 [Clostridia bacterium]|nr:hypothetical protein [Clostridia bacterium]
MKMKKLLALLFAAAALCLLAACAKTENSVPTGMKLASSEIVAYRLYVPENWTVDMSTGVTSAYVSSSDRSNLSVVFFDTTEAEGEDPAAYFARYQKEYKETLGDMTEPEESDAKLDGVDAKQYVWSAKVAGAEYRFLQIYCVKDGRIYLLTFTATPEKYEEHLEKLGIILANFRFA